MRPRFGGRRQRPGGGVRGHGGSAAVLVPAAEPDAVEAAEGLLPWWFPRRGRLPWRPRTEEVLRSSSNNHRGTAAAASDHAAFGRQHTRRRTAAWQYAKPHKHLRVRRGGTSRATRIPAAAIQNSGSHPIGIAWPIDFQATCPGCSRASPVPIVTLDCKIAERTRGRAGFLSHIIPSPVLLWGWQKLKKKEQLNKFFVMRVS